MEGGAIDDKSNSGNMIWIPSHTMARVSWIAFVSFVLIGVGTIGYCLIEGWSVFDSFYMTTITVSTVGFQEVHDLSTAGRAFTLVLIFGGVGVIAYAATNIATMVLDSTGALARIRMRSGSVKLSQHIIICGFGKLAGSVLSDLKDSGVDTVIIEHEEDRASEASSRGMKVILGDATEDETLSRAGVERARGLVLLMGSDGENVLAALSARAKNKSLLIVAEAISSKSSFRLLKAGVDQVIDPVSAAGRRMAHAFVRPAVVDLMDVATQDLDPSIRVKQFTVHSNSDLNGMSIRDSKIHEELDLLVVAVRQPDGETVYNPNGKLTLAADGSVIALGPLRNLKLLSDRCRGKKPKGAECAHADAQQV